MSGDKINPITPDGPWSAKAAAANAVERVEHNSPILCVWIDSKGHLKYSKANTDMKFASLVAVWAMDWATRFWSIK